VVAKTLIDIDEGLLARAAAQLGTRTKKETVTLALELVLRAAAFDDAVAFARSGGLDDASDPAVMKQAWR
jgi:Arc/MetJ family transcription regulator